MADIINDSPSNRECNNQALQTALELSMVNINSNLACVDPSDMHGSAFERYDLHLPKSQQEFAQCVSGPSKSLNVTQCVTVPSSEHVAEIVGKQGCKIKALRAKTNTYIKTPVRGEEPVFSISGRPDHVTKAKWEIIAAAVHFSQIRASRSFVPPANNPLIGPDKVTIFVRVPYRVVGLVVGPRGATVKRIQQLTHTFIVTPSRDKEPCFEVRGTPENVEQARKEIESYIVQRTGNKDMTDEDPIIGTHATDVLTQQMQHCQLAENMAFGVPPNSTDGYSEGYERSRGGNGYIRGGGDLDGIDNHEVHSDQADQWNYPKPTVFSGMRFVPPDISYQPLSAPLLTAEKVFDMGTMANNKAQPLSPTGSYESNSSDGIGTTSPKQSPLVQKRSWRCSMCMCKSDHQATGALVPCGHNMFCQTCAHYIACSSGSCPVCNAQVTNVMHI